MPDERDPRRHDPGGRDQRPDEAETLAALMDGTLALDDVGEDELDGLLRQMDSSELVDVIADAPKLFPPPDDPRTAVSRASSRRAHPVRWAIPLGAVAVVLIAVGSAVYLRGRPVATVDTGRTATVSSPAPPSASTTTLTQPASPEPVLLTARAEEIRGRGGEFRGTTADTHVPKREGTIVSVVDGSATIDLGSLDGIARGTVVRVFRGNHDAIGTIIVDRVFRERARGTAVSTDRLRPGDVAELDPAVHVGALVSAASDRLAAGDAEGARALAERAAALTPSAGVLPGQVSRAVADTLNDVGARLIANKQYADAEAVLQRAKDHASGATAVRVTNNLAAAAALRADFATAEQRYKDALALAGAAPQLDVERQAIEKNLDSLKAKK